MAGTGGDHLGNRVTDWVRALHMIGEPFDFAAYRWLVCLFGLVLSMLSVTGIVIWLKKRRARASSRSRQISISGAPRPGGRASLR
jgi:uncharacterized iron-regulated membrane protein